MVKVSRDEITPEHVYLNRRKFMVGLDAAGALALAACAAPVVQQAYGIQAAPIDPAICRKRWRTQSRRPRR